MSVMTDGRLSNLLRELHYPPYLVEKDHDRQVWYPLPSYVVDTAKRWEWMMHHRTEVLGFAVVLKTLFIHDRLQSQGTNIFYPSYNSWKAKGKTIRNYGADDYIYNGYLKQDDCDVVFIAREPYIQPFLWMLLSVSLYKDFEQGSPEDSRHWSS